MRNLAAFTPPQPLFPPYVNVSEDSDASVILTIRNKPYSVEGTGDFPGEIATIRLTREEAVSLFKGALKNMGAL